MYLLNFQNILLSLCLVLCTAVLCFLGLLWVAPVFSAIVFYAVIGMHLGDPKEYSFLDTKGLTKVFDINVLLAFVLFYFIPIYIPYLIIVWDPVTTDGLLAAALFKLAYIYDDIYLEYDVSRTVLTQYGYYKIPHMFSSLRQFVDPNPSFFRINFFCLCYA